MIHQFLLILLYTYITVGLVGLAAWILNAIFATTQKGDGPWSKARGRGDWWWYNG